MVKIIILSAGLVSGLALGVGASLADTADLGGRFEQRLESGDMAGCKEPAELRFASDFAS